MSAAVLQRIADAPPFDGVGGWSAPDMSILSAGRTTPPTMPGGIFGSLWPLVQDLAEGAGAPVDYVAISILGVAASLIGSTRRPQPFTTSPGWRDPCILWTALVGDPSSNKSPAIDAATAPLRGMEAELAETFKERVALHEAKRERAKAERAKWVKDVEGATKEGSPTPDMPGAAEMPEEPSRPRLLVQDSTPEALGEILAGNPRGVLHMRDELAGWLLSFERYSPGGREFWLEAYGGRHHVIDRKNLAKPLHIPFNGVSVIGGIQPEKLADCLLSVADDGLVPRFLWAWPDPIPYRRPRSIADTGLLEHVYRQLLSLRPVEGYDDQPTAGIVHLDDAAADVFEAWIRENDEAAGDTASIYKSFLGKLKGTALRLALIAEMMDWAAGSSGPEPTTIGVPKLAAVLDFLDTYAKPTALRVFGDAALPVSERNAALLARHVLRTSAKRVNARDIRRSSGIPTLKQAQDVDAATEALVDAGWLRPAPARTGSSPGRASKDFIVNPAVFNV